MEDIRLKLTPGLRSLLDYPRFAGAPRVLILGTEYFFETSWARAATELGWESASVPSAMTGGLTRDQVQQFFATTCSFRPDFVLGCNYAGMDAGGLFARFLEDARIPYVTYFTDTPRMILFDRTVPTGEFAVAATWERAYIPYLRDVVGFQHTLFWPLATDPAFFHGAPQRATTRDVAFVGRSMVEQTEETWTKLAPYPDVIEAIYAALARGLSKEDFCRGIQGILGKALLERVPPSLLRHIENAFNYEHTRRHRAALIAALAPLDVRVHGDNGWLTCCSNVGGSVGYFTDLGPFYRETAVNVNLTALQMPYAVNQRVFDCPAAGGFLITDIQADLEELFAADETVTYTSFEDALEKASYYLTHQEERVAIVQRAQRRIASEHTYSHRLRTLGTFLRAHFQS